MKLDPILMEIRAVREAYAEKFHGDVKALLADVRQRQQESMRTVVSRPARRLAASEEHVASGDRRIPH